MIKKIFKFSYSVFLVVSILTSNLIAVSPALAVQTNSEINLDNSDGIIFNESDVNISSSKVNTAPDLGDDQTFPFIPGFGKNSGKD